MKQKMYIHNYIIRLKILNFSFKIKNSIATFAYRTVYVNSLKLTYLPLNQFRIEEWAIQPTGSFRFILIAKLYQMNPFMKLP